MEAKFIDERDFIPLLDERLSKNRNGKITALFYIEFDDFSYLGEILRYIDDIELDVKIQSQLAPVTDEKMLCGNLGRYRYVIVKEIDTINEVEAFARSVIHMFAAPCTIDEHLFYLFLTVGISLHPTEISDADGLIYAARSAMKQIRKEGKNLIGMPQSRHYAVSSDLYAAILKDMPNALDNGEIHFLFQPQYDCNSERFVGAELLCRWDHPRLGFISPSVFIPIAEHNGMISPLIVRSIVAAAKAFERLDALGHHHITLSVNISPHFLNMGEFDQTIDFLVSEYGLDNGRMRFEITEEMLMEHTAHLKQTLRKLKQHRIGIELDDFGTGYTSLQHLVSLPIDTLKIDRSFIRKIERNKRKKALCKAIIDMSEALEIEVISEGIETVEEERILRELGASVMQGYRYARPLPLDGVVSLLSRQHDICKIIPTDLFKKT